MSNNNQNILALTALKIEQLSQSELDQVFIDLAENRLSAKEINQLEVKISGIPELENKFRLFKPISKDFAFQLEDQIINKLEAEREIYQPVNAKSPKKVCDSFLPDLSEQEYQEYQAVKSSPTWFEKSLTDIPIALNKEQTNKEQRNTSQINNERINDEQTKKAHPQNSPKSNFLRVIRNILQPSPYAIAACSALFITLATWYSSEPNTSKIPEYAMLISGHNNHYRAISERNIIEISQHADQKDNAIDVFSQNKLNIILRPNSSHKEELDVQTYFYQDNELIEISNKIMRAPTGTFKIAPQIPINSFSTNSNKAVLAVVIKNQNSKISHQQIIEQIDKGNPTYQSTDWIYLSQKINLKQ
ncbi:hypothetical protein FLL45_18765 [Aliikangiella marina]|uniref:Uncharacterized protein n=1 Tax=Aliikangiella marina TaxID=1712262 RepID=A0A545T512_9GAMM|nr:hypothetical protein [Aliikangiella marina]TQV72262.1 hypothetical protein FLL45_18765 [Aliikangiella marina]